MFKRTILVVILGVVPLLHSAGTDATSARERKADNTAAADIKTATRPRYTDAEVARVSTWIREKVPNCPSEIVLSAAQHFLEELGSRRPEQLERLLSDDLSASTFSSALLQNVSSALTAPQQLPLREELARKRVEVLIAAEGSLGGVKAIELVDKLKLSSQYYYRRLLEGKIDDDSLVPLLKRAVQPSTVSGAKVAALPKAMSATDIISEYARRNQVGSASEKIHAYTVEATLKTATGEIQRLILSRMRPNRFHLVVKVGEETKLVLASNGHTYWQQSPGGRAVELSRESVGSKAYLGEYMAVFFSTEGYAAERIDDGQVSGRKVYRLRIRRVDGTTYVSCIDTENFRELARENSNSYNVVFSDFREIEGVTFAFREDVKDEQGRSAVFEIQRLSPNPGIVRAYFEAVDLGEPSSFAVDQLWSKASPSSGVAR